MQALAFENSGKVGSGQARVRVIKTFSAERSSNKCKNKVTKEVLIPVNILNTVKKALSIL